MSSKNDCLQIENDLNKQKVELQVIEILNKTNYSLNIVNRYKENIIHISAANDCINIIKCILQKNDTHCLERKNTFGWTPLMQAIRNENIEMVKFLLSCGVVVNDFSFLGVSVLTLASAISSEMFDIIYNNCPSALEYAAHDDINPLCIAALKNDKELFFKLIDLGLDINKANAFTHTLMKHSTVPEIAVLAKLHLSSEDYWNDLSDIEDLLKETLNYENSNNRYTEIKRNNNIEIHSSIAKICIEPEKRIVSENLKDKKTRSNLKSSKKNFKWKNLISPKLSCFRTNLSLSPNIFFAKDNSMNTFTKYALNIKDKVNKTKSKKENQSPVIKTENYSSTTPLVLQRCQNKRPPNLRLRHYSSDLNTTLSFTPQFSPTKSPNLPQNFNEDNIFDETTPTPPKYKTPPRGIILDPSTSRLICLLKRFGLKRHIPIFLEQEVDLDLFLTLNEKDLIEIGIDSKSERLILLSVINECKESEIGMF